MTFTHEQRREIQAIVMTAGANKRGIITSYQPAPPLVKVQIMPPPPDGSTPPETGWIPYKSWATGLEGTGWSVVAPPQVGQQVLLICEEADGGNFTAWGGYYSEVDPAPQGAQPGEIMFAHQTGAQLYLKADGTMTLLASTLNIAGPAGAKATVNISGSLNVSDETTTAGIAFTPHIHDGIASGDQQTGGPIEPAGAVS